jgi:hypothetical protein
VLSDWSLYGSDEDGTPFVDTFNVNALEDSGIDVIAVLIGNSVGNMTTVLKDKNNSVDDDTDFDASIMDYKLKEDSYIATLKEVFSDDAIESRAQMIYLSQDVTDQAKEDEFRLLLPRHWLVGHDNQQVLENIRAVIGPISSPRLFVFSLDGKTMYSSDAIPHVNTHQEDGFPWDPVSIESIEREYFKDLAFLSEAKVINKSNKEISIKQLAGNNEMIALYFSVYKEYDKNVADLTRRLIDLYTELRYAKKKVEIIYISYDREQVDWVRSFAEMPWLSIPWNLQNYRDKIASKLGVEDRMPSLVWIDPKTGAVINSEGLDVVKCKLGPDDFPFTLEALRDKKRVLDRLERRMRK